MEINKATILEIVKKSAIRPNKALGQNFLIDPAISSRIIHALDIQEKEKILEIGPGLGSLTHFLSTKSNEIEIVEIDSKIVDLLNVIYKETKNVKIIHKDILKVDFSSYDKIVGNLPYYITTEIITKILLGAQKCQKMVFMIQKEAFPRFFNKVNEPSYSPVGILISLLGNIKKICHVGKSSFYPNPHIDSVVFEISIDPNKKTKANFEIYHLAKSLFANKRKTILNNLTFLLKDKEKSAQLLEQLNINTNLRPENLSAQDYINLYLSINSYSNPLKEIE
ncbi:MAG: 16S rRNA (adenine(1518)-N(6)/adenine(1519)-N(6))-dimethyltransferase RsmA [Bacilli bacterium]